MALGATACDPPRTADWRSELASPSVPGPIGGNRASNAADMSPDGTRMLFTSVATDLGPTDSTPGVGLDLFLRDLTGRTTTRITSTPGGDGGNGDTQYAHFSPDGSQVVLVTTASNLGAADGNGQPDVYLYDLASRTLRLVSVNAAGTAAGAGASVNPRFSPDGRRIAFQSSAADLGPADANGATDVYVRDLAARTTELASVNTAGTAAGNAASELAGAGSPFSADGTRLAFSSRALDLVPLVPTATSNVFVRDFASDTTTVASAAPGIRPLPDGGDFLVPSMSPDGSTVAFLARYRDNSQNPPIRQNVWVHDLAAGTTTLVAKAGPAPATGTPPGPWSTGDGATIVFGSAAADLVAGDANGAPDVFAYDVAAGSLRLVSATPDGAHSGAGASTLVAVSADGRSVAFTSAATDLVASRSVTGTDLFVRRLDTNKTQLVSLDESGDAGAGGVIGGFPSADGSAFAYASTANTLDQASRTPAKPQVYAARVQPFSTGDLSVELHVAPTSASVTIRNAGPGAVPAVRVRIDLPAGMDFDAAAPIFSTGVSIEGCATSGAAGQRTMTCTYRSLPAMTGSQFAAISIPVVTTAPSGTSLQVTAIVSAARHVEPRTQDNASVVTFVVP